MIIASTGQTLITFFGALIDEHKASAIKIHQIMYLHNYNITVKTTSTYHYYYYYYYYVFLQALPLTLSISCLP